jgi:tripartite-type tricarboxylate transporter receptor subunit TctC
MPEAIRYPVAAAVAALMMSSGASVIAADFYDGKTIRIISAGNPGGGQDVSARVIADHLGRHIPGNPKVIIQNMPGGNGIPVGNQVFNVAKKDGTEIGQFHRDSVILAILGAPEAKFNPGEFGWLGSPTSYSDSAYAIVVRSGLPYKGIFDMRQAKEPVSLGNSAGILVPLVKHALGANAKIIEGYKSNEVNLALERGEVDGLGRNYTNIVRQSPHWLSQNIARVVVQFGHSKRLPELPDVPTGRELAQTADDQALVRFAELPLTFGYAFGLPPGVPAERLALLRKAFNDTTVDPQYVAAVEKAKLEHTPQTGEELGEKVKDASGASQNVLARYKILAGESGSSAP